ncbi:hypothetical protein [Clostridium sp.]|uniref:hypothetical protein n=1 Tax=Clostridium sp. TaxID=1506 RepID=UPI001B6DD67D|nr:hypothetical protein [Clostridium sp.]MBP3916208.1 hypothetical protein [Clostridium sp.]
MLKLEDLIKDFNLEIIKKGKDDVIVKSNDINRPGLELAGYYNYFSNERVQIIGKAEVNYLNDMEYELKKRRVKKYLDLGVEFIIITRGLNYPFEFIEYAIENNIWLLRTDMTTTSFISEPLHLSGAQMGLLCPLNRSNLLQRQPLAHRSWYLYTMSNIY